MDDENPGPNALVRQQTCMAVRAANEARFESNERKLAVLDSRMWFIVTGIIIQIAISTYLLIVNIG